MPDYLAGGEAFGATNLRAICSKPAGKGNHAVHALGEGGILTAALAALATSLLRPKLWQHRIAASSMMRESEGDSELFIWESEDAADASRRMLD
jgi:hypothetical protein